MRHPLERRGAPGQAGRLLARFARIERARRPAPASRQLQRRPLQAGNAALLRAFLRLERRGTPIWTRGR